MADVRKLAVALGAMTAEKADAPTGAPRWQLSSPQDARLIKGRLYVGR